MANSIHLKRHSMPISWPVKRKNITFVAKPNPGSHKLEYVVPVVVLLRDHLGYASTAKEVKRLIHTNEVLVNGKKVNDIKKPVGLFDIFEIKETGEKYTVLFSDVGGRLKLVPTKDDLIYLKVSGKKTLPSNKYQLNFMNGFNILVDEKTFNNTKVNDTVVYDLKSKKIKEVLPLKEGVFVYIFDGKFRGKFAKYVSVIEYNGITKDVANVEINGVTHSTSKDYCYVVAKDEKSLERFN